MVRMTLHGEKKKLMCIGCKEMKWNKGLELGIYEKTMARVYFTYLCKLI